MQITRDDDIRTHQILTRIYEWIRGMHGDDIANLITLEDGMYLDDLEYRLNHFDVTLLTARNFHIYSDVMGKYVLIKQMQSKIIETIRNVEGSKKQ